MKKIYLALASILIDGGIWGGMNMTFAQGFSDVVEGVHNLEAIEWIQEKGWISGYSDGSFRPQEKINRAEFLKMVVEAKREDDSKMIKSGNLQSGFENGAYYYCDETAMGAGDLSGGLKEFSSFKDDNGKEWYSKYLCIGEKAGWVSGYADGKFRPEQNVNYAEATKILVKSEVVFSDEHDDCLFGIASEDSPWYLEDVTCFGWHGGLPDSVISFDQFLSREEVAEMIYRVKTEVKGYADGGYSRLEDLTLITRYYRYLSSGKLKEAFAMKIGNKPAFADFEKKYSNVVEAKISNVVDLGTFEQKEVIYDYKEMFWYYACSYEKDSLDPCIVKINEDLNKYRFTVELKEIDRDGYLNSHYAVEMVVDRFDGKLKTISAVKVDDIICAICFSPDF